MLRTEKRMRLCLTLLILNLCFIWGNSLMPGSVSGAFSDWVKGILALIFPMESPSEGGGFLIRKLAHFSEFAALGTLLSWLTAMLGRKRPLPLFLGLGAACIDETIQIFVPDRGPGLRDVAIDFGGVVTGAALLWLGHKLYRTFQHLEEK